MFVRFIEQCLTKDPNQRPTSHLLLQNEFIRIAKDEEILFQLVERSKEVVRELDDRNYRCACVIVVMAILPGRMGGLQPTPV